jgi:hypothetical protein
MRHFPLLVEAGPPPWFRRLQRFRRLVSNAANTGRSQEAACNADWKAPGAASLYMQTATYRKHIFQPRATRVLFEQDILHMVLFEEFSPIGSGAF